MEDNKKTLNESLDRIKNMMGYDPEIPLTEQTAKELRKSGIETRREANATRKAEIDYSRLNWYIRRLERNMKDIDTIYGHLQGKTYEGHEALEVAKATYKEKSGRDLPEPKMAVKPEVDAVTGAAVPAVAPGQSTQKTQYPPCQGGVNKVGCKSNAIAQVQSMIGGGLKPDGMFGTKTQQRLARIIPAYSSQFTDADVQKIKDKLALDAEHGITHGMGEPSKLNLASNRPQVAPPAARPDTIPTA